MSATNFNDYVKEQEETRTDAGEEVEFDWELNDDGSLTVEFDDESFVISADDMREIHDAVMTQDNGDE